jgi:hypothetical protein
MALEINRDAVTNPVALHRKCSATVTRAQKGVDIVLLEREIKRAKSSRRRASIPSILRRYDPYRMGGHDDRTEAEKGTGGGLFQPLDTSWSHTKGLRINNDLTVLR